MVDGHIHIERGKMQVIIAVATKMDVQGIFELYKQSDMDDGKVLSIEQAEMIFDRINSYSNYKIYVAKVNDVIVGTFALAIMDNMAHLGTPSGVIEDVVVKTDFQGKGIGKQMMEYAMKCCKKNGCYKVSLSSNLKREEAHRFYESLGYKKHGYSFLLELDNGM